MSEVAVKAVKNLKEILLNRRQSIIIKNKAIVQGKRHVNTIKKGVPLIALDDGKIFEALT